MSRIHDESGFTLTELLIGMVVMIIVLTATLTSFDTFNTARARNDRLNDAQQPARTTIDSLAVQLRNLANPSNTNTTTMDTAGKYRLIFQTTDPSKRWVGYCLATSGNGNGVITVNPSASASDEVLYIQTSATVTSISANMRGGAAGACPATGWDTTKVQVRKVVNQRLAGGTPLDRPVFTYNTCTTGASTCLSQITDVNATVWIDTDVTRPPAEVPISTGVFLRNQNQVPTAAWAATQGAQTRTWLLNATLSNDPEGRTLAMQWYKGPSGSTVATLPDCVGTTTNTAGTCIGTGNNPLFNYTFPAADGNSTTIYLKVTDPGGLSALCSQALPLATISSSVSCP